GGGGGGGGAGGGGGGGGPRPVLLEELHRDPAREIVAALAGIADDDIAVHLGRCAESHPALAGAVAAALEEIETERSLKIARRIRSPQARRPD
ncbi:MAG: hypothetical protein OXI22_14530, partial [Defluviicoccus sp.]|nr:hypothetical protein [Defluviicoccus sp.]